MKEDCSRYILVTGGAGFIGSGVIKHLNDKGLRNIVAIDELGTDEKWKNLVGKQLSDIVDKNRMFEWLKGRESEVEAIIHLGACSSTVERNASYLLENNTYFSQRVAEFAFTHDVRFIYASSASTYGDGSKGFSDDHSRLDELYPLNMYGFSKHFFDLWLREQDLLDKCVGLKYFNVYGPNEYHKGRMASALLKMLPAAQHQGVVRLFKSNEPDRFSDGGQKRDFIYVKDAVRMTCAFLNNRAGGIFNIGRGVAETWNDVAKALFKALGKNPRIDYVEMPEDLIGKYQNYTCADMAKTRAVLGIEAECQLLEESVCDYVQNYLISGTTW